MAKAKVKIDPNSGGAKAARARQDAERRAIAKETGTRTMPKRKGGK